MDAILCSEEIAAEMDLDVEQNCYIQKISQETVSLEASVGDSDEETAVPGDFIEDTETLMRTSRHRASFLKGHIERGAWQTSRRGTKNSPNSFRIGRWHYAYFARGGTRVRADARTHPSNRSQAVRRRFEIMILRKRGIIKKVHKVVKFVKFVSREGEWRDIQDIADIWEVRGGDAK